jgi:hypothetical protein
MDDLGQRVDRVLYRIGMKPYPTRRVPVKNIHQSPRHGEARGQEDIQSISPTVVKSQMCVRVSQIGG